MTSFVPMGDHPVIPARFRIFPNYDLQNPGDAGNEIQPGSQQAPMYQNSRRDFLNTTGHQNAEGLLTRDKRRTVFFDSESHSLWR